jgi:hypothetical protein
MSEEEQATANATADPYGMTDKRTGNDKGECGDSSLHPTE